MNDAGILFLSLLAVLCQAFVVTCVVLKSASYFSSGAARAWNALANALAPVALWFAFAVAAVTMAGSLYLSEVKGYVPCRLCWYQRGLLYPTVLLSLVAAAWSRWRKAARWMLVALVVIDLPVSAYHVLLEIYPTLATSACSVSAPCTLVYFRQFGYLTTPGMAFTAAATLLTLALLSRRADQSSEVTGDQANG